MRADAGTLEEVLGPLRGLLAELKAARKATGKFVDPGTWAEKDFVPTPVLQLLERLTYLLGLSDLEWEFVNASASDEMMDAFDGRLAYADWLEEQGDETAGLRLRKLTPQPGDVLAFKLPRHMGNVADVWAGAVTDSLRALERRGVGVTAVVLPHGARLDQLSEAQMAGLGWVPAGRVAEVREACARLCDRADIYANPADLAAAIRAKVDPPA